MADLRSQGYGASHGGIEISGFPGSVRARIASPQFIASPREPVRWTWAAENVPVTIDPWDPRRLTVHLDGRHGFTTGEDRTLRTYTGEAEELMVTAEAGVKPRTVSLSLKRLRVSGERGPIVTVAELDAVGRGIGPEQSDTPEGSDAHSYHVSVEANDMALPGAGRLPLGSRIEHIGLDGTMHGQLDGPSTAAAIRRWADDGGVMDVSRLEVDYGPVSLSGDGTLSIDPNGQPLAAFSARVRGIFAAIDALRSHGYLEQSDAMAAKMGLHILAGSADRNAVLQVPVSLQDRILSVGPVALIKVPEVHW